MPRSGFNFGSGFFVDIPEYKLKDFRAHQEVSSSTIEDLHSTASRCSVSHKAPPGKGISK